MKFVGLKDRESNFRHCRVPVKLVQACLSEERLRKQFSPLGRSCEARAGLFKCGEGPRK